MTPLSRNNRTESLGLRAGGWRAAVARVRAPGAGLTWVLFGKAGLMGANTALLLFLAARLPVAVYGMFVAVAGAQVVLSRAVLAGTDGGVVRLSSQGGSLRRPECIGAGLAILRRTAMLATAAGLLAALLPLPWPRWVGPVVAAGGIGIALVDFGYYCRLAQLDYRSASAVQGAMGFVRLVLTVTALFVWPAHPAAAFIGYGLGGLLAGLLQLRSAARHATRPPAGAVKHLFRYSAWQGGASLICSGALQVGTFIFLSLGKHEAAGIFGLGLSLSLPFFFLYNAYFEFLLPRISRVSGGRALFVAILTWSGVAVALSGACVPVAIVAAMIFPKVFHSNLLAAIPVFYWLAASHTLLLVQAVFEAASHSLLRPVYVLVAWATRLVATAAAISILAQTGDPVRGGMGQFLGALISVVLIGLLVIGSMRRQPRVRVVAA